MGSKTLYAAKGKAFENCINHYLALRFLCERSCPSCPDRPVRRYRLPGCSGGAIRSNRHSSISQDQGIGLGLSIKGKGTMNRLLIAVLTCIALPSFAANPDCDFKSFPDFWADAQSRVERLSAQLKTVENETPYSNASATAFRRSLGLCEAKVKDVWKGAPSGSGMALAKSKCEALLICARLTAIDPKF